MSSNYLKLISVIFLAILLFLPLGALASININTATAQELQQVKGIGPKTAEKIVAYRTEHGQFSNLDDLCNINGIGAKSLSKMAADLCTQ